MEIDITPAMNTYVPRSMLMPVGGVDPSSTRTFLPLALHTSSGIYNQKMNEANKMIMSKAKVSSDFDTLGSSVDKELVTKDEIEDYLEEKFDNLHESSSDDEEYVCESCSQKQDGLGGSSTVLNDILLQKHMKDTQAKPSETIDTLFNNYLKDNKESVPLGTHTEGELQNPGKNDSNKADETELNELVGNGIVYEKPIQIITIPLIVIILIIMLVLTIMMFYGKLFYYNEIYSSND